MGIFLSIVSCGYRPLEATIPGGGDKIAIPVVENHTSYRGLTGPLTAAVRKRVARAGVEVSSKQQGIPRLEVTIILIENEPGMLTVSGDNLDAMDSIRSIHAEVSLVDVNGQVIKGPHRFEVQGRAYSGGSPISDESLGHRKLRSLLDDLAENVVSHFLTM